MYAQMKNPKENKNRHFINPISCKKNTQRPLQFVDNRLENAKIKNMQNKMNRSKKNNLGNKKYYNNLLTKVQKSIVQRKIYAEDEWNSFQSVYDSNGNPFLSGHNTKKKKALDKYQPDIKLKEVDSYTQTLNEDTKKNIFRNISYYRPTIVETPGGKINRFVPFKTYNFNPQTQHDIAVFPKEERRGYLYNEFYNQGTENLEKDIKKITKKKNPVLDKIDEMNKDMEGIIYGEDYRTRGALSYYKEKFNKTRENIEGIKKVIKKKKRRKKMKKRIEKQIKSITTELPFSGTGGKKNFREKVKSGKYDKIITKEEKEFNPPEGYFCGFNSPYREDEDPSEPPSPMSL